VRHLGAKDDASPDVDSRTETLAARFWIAALDPGIRGEYANVKTDDLADHPWAAQYDSARQRAGELAAEITENAYIAALIDELACARVELARERVVVAEEAQRSLASFRQQLAEVTAELATERTRAADLVAD